ncbi:hypothetical protein BH11BAC6_BH11BAC6_12860 [soil metagenome]
MKENGTINYRVAAVNKNGKVLYSNVITIEDEINVKLYPNPVSNMLHIEGLPANTKTKLTITDLNGNVRMAATANTVSFVWNISKLQKGSYMVRVETNGLVTNTTFIKE